MGYNIHPFYIDEIQPVVSYYDSYEDDSDDDAVNNLEFHSDKLDKAFKILESKDIVCRKNWTCCQSCGVNGIQKELTEESIGFTFYHIQDAERANDKGELYLTYDSIDDDVAGFANKIINVLQTTGLVTEWDGSTRTRIKVSGF